MVMPKRKTGPAVKGLAAFSETLAKAFKLAEEHPEMLPGHGPEQGNPITLAPRIPEASEMADKMVANATAAGNRWLENTLRPRKDPIAGMKKAKDKYKTRMQESLTEDRWAKGVENIDENEMYEIIQSAGAGAFTSGIERRKGKITRRLEKMRPLLLALSNTLDAMPTNTDQQREQKMVAARRGMIEIGKKMRS